MAQLRSRLRPMLTGGTAVVLATFLASNLLRILSSVTLTRLLDAEAFGVVGIILSMSTVFGLISDIGVIPFVVRHEQGDDPRFLDEVWTTRLVRGVGLSLLMWALSQPLASYAGKPELQAVIAVFGIGFAIEGLSSLVFATELRSHRVKKLSVVDLVASSFQVLSAIVLAVAIRSYWAMVAAALLLQVMRTLLSYWMFPGSGRRIRFNRARIRELWRFSGFIMSSSILTVLIGQADKLFFARLFSLEMFGLYSIAASLAATPVAFALAHAERVLYPAYAATFRTEPERLRETYYARKRNPSLLYMFAVGGLVGAAPLVVAILYDPRYAPSGSILSILSISSMFILNTWAADRLLVATGRSWSTLAGNLTRFAWLMSGALLTFVTHNPRLLIYVVGTIELPTLLLFAVLQRRYGYFDWRQELLVLGVAPVGIGLGMAVSSLALRFLHL